MSEYRIEKDRFPVKIFLMDGTVHEGDIFLSIRAAYHEGREHAIDLLNQPEPFLPVLFKEGPVKLIHKNNLLMISYPFGEEEKEEAVFADISVEVVVHLINQTQLEGSFFFLLPTHARRVKDFLNQRDSFLELRTESEIYLIHKKHILSVEEK